MRRMMIITVVTLVAVASGLAQASLSLATQAHAIPIKGVSASQPIASYNGIQYNGGPVMNHVNGVNVYFIWYGNWTNTTVPTILTDFINHIGGSAYFNINTSYYDFNKFVNGVKDPVVNRVTYGGSVYDNYSLGSSLTDNNIANIVGFAIGGPDKLPIDPNGVYFVLTSPDVIETSGFCSAYCAWHSYGILQNGNSSSGTPIKVGFIGNPDQCPHTCAFQAQLPTPNNSVAADGMASAIAHELSETVTDPLLNAWINPGIIQNGVLSGENGDLCVWKFGTTKVLPNGSIYNLIFGTRPYLIQQIWANAGGGYCALSLDGLQ